LFPKPHKIAWRVTGWHVEEVKQWMIARGLLAPDNTQSPLMSVACR
jgi:hypothetical protein